MESLERDGGAVNYNEYRFCRLIRAIGTGLAIVCIYSELGPACGVLFLAIYLHTITDYL